MKARALIIISGTNDCSLSAAVQTIMGPVQKRLGDKCPFTIIGYCSVYQIYRNTKLDEKWDEGEKNDSLTIAEQYYKGSKNFQKGARDTINKAVKEETEKRETIEKTTHFFEKNQ